MLEQPGFGVRLRQLRKQQNKSQADLAGPGMSTAYLSRLESGDRPPTSRAVAYLASQLGVAIDSFEREPEGSLADIVANVSTLSETELDTGTVKVLTTALEATVEADPMTRWYGLGQLARNYMVLGDFSRQREALVALTSLSDALARPLLQVRARLWIAQCTRNLGDVQAARQAVREVLALSEQHHLSISAADLVRSKLVLVSAEAELGNFAEAARLSEEVCASLESPDGALAAEAYWTVATVSTQRGNYDNAFAWLLKALAAIHSRDDLLLWIRLRLAAASLSIQAVPPRLTEVQSFLDSVESALQLVGTARHDQEFLFLKAELAFHQGNVQRAMDLAAQLEADAKILSYRDQIRFEVLQGLLAVRLGDKEAGSRLRELASRVQAANMPILALEVWRAVAEGTQ